MKPLAASDPTTIASYRLLGVLGAGGMGRVYLGQSRSGRRVAIKVIRAELAEDSSFRLRFAREVASARTVSPLYTAAVVDADTEAALPWLATTYIDGPSLEELVAERGPMAPGPVLTLAAGLAEALASIHGVGLVHRDLKPSNVLLDDSGPHIIDFGIALAPNVTRMTTSLVVGTPSFMAPERIHGSEAGSAGDIFSLGATLVYAATARNLVNDGTMYAQIMQITLGRYDLSALPAPLRPLVVRCVSKRPDDRPTAAELTRILAASGVTPPGPGWQIAGAAPPVVHVAAPRRVQLRRRTLLVLGGVVGAAAVSGGLAAAAGMFNRRGFGSVLWQVRTNAGPPRQGSPALGERVLVHQGQHIIAIDGREVIAVDRRGQPLWRQSSVAEPGGLLLWGDTVLAVGDQRLWLLDPVTGALRQPGIDVAQREQDAAGSAGPPHILGVTVAPDRAYLNLGSALVGLDGLGEMVWRSPRPPAPVGGQAPELGNPTRADADLLVTQSVQGSAARTALYDTRTRSCRWTQQYQLTAEPGRQPPAEPSGSPPGPGGPDGPGGPGGPDGPGRDGRPDAHVLTEARLVPGMVMVRDHHEVRGLRTSGGPELIHIVSPTPMSALEVTDDGLFIAAGDLRLYSRDGTTVSATFGLHDARLAPIDNRTVVAAGDGRLMVIDARSGSSRAASLPPELARAPIERVSVENRVAYITVQPGPRGQETPDVIAVALD
ncbi:MAG: protein kinase domain-containing protein [Micromonosporaceae bacterium]